MRIVPKPKNFFEHEMYVEGTKLEIFLFKIKCKINNTFQLWTYKIDRIRWVIIWRKTFTRLVDYLCMCIWKGDDIWIANHINHPVSKLTFKLYKIANDVEYFIRGKPNWDQWDEQNNIIKADFKSLRKMTKNLYSMR